MSLGASGVERKTKRTRKHELLDAMNLVAPWCKVVSLISPRTPMRSAKGGRPPFAVNTMLRIHFLNQWFNLSDPTMAIALYDTALFLELAGIDTGEGRLPDESSVLHFRHLLEAHNLIVQSPATVNAKLTAQGLLLKEGAVVDATLITPPSSTKNQDWERDPERHQTKKSNQWHFGKKAHAGVDTESGLVNTVVGTTVNVNGVTQASALIRGEEAEVFVDSSYRGVEKREEIQAQQSDVNWHIAMMLGKRKVLDNDRPKNAILEKLKQTKASIRAKVEQPIRSSSDSFSTCKCAAGD